MTDSELIAIRDGFECVLIKLFVLVKDNPLCDVRSARPEQKDGDKMCEPTVGQLWNLHRDRTRWRAFSDGFLGRGNGDCAPLLRSWD